MKRRIGIILLSSALLLVLAGIVAVLSFSMRDGGGFFFPGKTQASATVEETKTLKVDSKKPVVLTVIDDVGSVTIVGADVETVQVKAVKTSHAATQSRAADALKDLVYSIEQDDNRIILKYDLPDMNVFDLDALNEIDFIVTVPRETKLNVDSNVGDVSVSGLKGNVIINNDFGDVSVENIEGALSVSSNSGHVTATSIKAGAENIEINSDFGEITVENSSAKNITLDSNSGTITLKDVRASGDITTQTDFGDTSFENGSSGSLNVDTNSGTISLTKINVSKELVGQDDFGNIELQQAIAGSYDLHTNSGSITVDGVKNILKASTDFGNIEVTNAQGVTLDLKTNSGEVQFSGSLGKGPHLIKSDFGGIGLTLPTDAKLIVNLKTDFGDITSDLPVTITTNGSSDSSNSELVGSINGGGELFTVKTNSGSISIKILDK